MSRIAEKYYTVSELAWTYGYSDWTIRQWIRQGQFGPPERLLIIGKDLRVPASGAVFFEDNHRNIHVAARNAANAVKGRTLGEARRKARGVSSFKCPDSSAEEPAA